MSPQYPLDRDRQPAQLLYAVWRQASHSVPGPDSAMAVVSATNISPRAAAPAHFIFVMDVLSMEGCRRSFDEAFSRSHAATSRTFSRCRPPSSAQRQRLALRPAMLAHEGIVATARHRSIIVSRQGVAFRCASFPLPSANAIR